MTRPDSSNGDPPFPTDEQYQPRNLMGTWNPDTWDPDPPDRDGRPTVNVWDPVERRGVDVPGHSADRDPDMSKRHARRLALRGDFDDLDGDQPLPLLSSNMRADPVEGVQGSFSRVTRLEVDCPECPSDYAVHVCHSTLGGVHSEHCLLCDAELVQP